MEQLARRDTDQTQGRMMEVVMVMKKVEFRLTREQMASLGRIISSYLGNLSLRLIDDKAVFFLLYQFYESKIRKKMLTVKPDFKISLDMPLAWAMHSMLMDIELSKWPYEHNLSFFIISEIDHQTA